MLAFLLKVLDICAFTFEFLLLLFVSWSFWHGSKIESNGIIVEFYGIKRFFNK